MKGTSNIIFILFFFSLVFLGYLTLSETIDFKTTIALSALLVSLYSAYQTRKNNRDNQRPILAGEYSAHTGLGFYVGVRNVGNGPAKFKSGAISVFGQSFDLKHNDGTNLLHTVIKDKTELSKYNFRVSSRIYGDNDEWFPCSNDIEKIFSITINFSELESSEAVMIEDETRKLIKSMGLSIQYESIHGEDFKLNTFYKTGHVAQ